MRRILRALRFARLRRVRPVSEMWGFDRGTPVDRFYIERFLEEHRGDIRGRALEVKDSGYVDRFGNGVSRVDVLDIDAENPRATVVADLAAADSVGEDTYDCLVLTQTLHVIWNVRSALRHVHRILRPDGVLLATLPAVSRLLPRRGLEDDYWRFTPASARRLFAEPFGEENVEVASGGNVLTCAAFLMGLAVEELTPREMEHHDPFFPLIVTVRAVKRTAAR